MFVTKEFTDPAAALAYASEIYAVHTAQLRDAFKRFSAGAMPEGRTRACYPFVRITTTRSTQVDARMSFGFVSGPGVHETTLTRPELYAQYLTHQFKLLRNNHGVPLEIGVSEQPIPVHFAFPEGIHVEGDLDPDHLRHLPDLFDLPDLAAMDDRIVNGTYESAPGMPPVHPLALFSASRIDYSLHRLRHYTATSPDQFQRYVLFTNYGFYVDEFIRLGRSLMAPIDDAEQRAYSQQYVSFVEPGNVITWNANLETPPPGQRTASAGVAPARQPQMPAYHLQRADGSGITLVNIGVGPSNAKTITDHIAVLRPNGWIMLGHCAGLSAAQRMGDYVLAHAYVRDDHVLDDDLPLWVPIPALAEVQLALQEAVAGITQLEGYELKRIMRTGTVASVDDRNWELRDHRIPLLRFSQSRAIALDMESATVAANGFRFRVPYGTLLCVSDKPLHGEIKLPGMANRFYEQRVAQHLKIGIKALELLRNNGMERLHSRKLRSYGEPAFR